MVEKSGRMLRQRQREPQIVPAYLVVQRTMIYRDAVMPLLIAKYGGKAVARGDVEVEGIHNNRSMVMFEFPSMNDLRDFWNSPEYVPVKKLREGAAVLDVWAVPGA